MAVDPQPRARHPRGPPVRRHRLRKAPRLLVHTRAVAVHHGHPRVRLGADDPDRLRAALEEPPRRRRLVRRAAAPRAARPEQARVRELHEQLRPGVGGHAERLDRRLAVRGPHDAHRLAAGERVGRRGCGADGGFRLGGDVPVERGRHGGRRGGRRGRGEAGRGDRVQGAVAQRDGRGAVHDGVFADKAGLAVVRDDDLHGLVHPPVPQAHLLRGRLGGGVEWRRAVP